MSTLCSKCPSVVQEFGDQICPAVLYLLDETEPAPITSLWQAVLHVIITVPVCVLCLNLVTSCQARKLNKEDAMDRCKWRKVIKEARWSGWVWVGECFFWYLPTRVAPDQRPLNGHYCCSKRVHWNFWHPDYRKSQQPTELICVLIIVLESVVFILLSVSLNYCSYFSLLDY